MARATYTAAQRGRYVVLCEKEDELGGILKSGQALPFKYEMYQLAGTYARFCREAGVEIRLNTPADRAYVDEMAPDAVIIAAGSSPLVPPIPGLDGDNVVVVNNYYKEKAGREVVVMGGGLAGCECAIHLAQEGKTVRLVEMRDELAPDANVRHRPLMLRQMEDLGEHLTVYTGHKALKATGEGVVCEDKGGKEVLIPGASVICALGQRSRTDVVETLNGSAPFVRVIGDSAKVSTITNAVYWGYHAAPEKALAPTADRVCPPRRRHGQRPSPWRAVCMPLNPSAGRWPFVPRADFSPPSTGRPAGRRPHSPPFPPRCS